MADTFGQIQKKAMEIVDFHMVSHGLTPEFTDDEKSAIELGMSSGIHAAIEYFAGATVTDPVDAENDPRHALITAAIHLTRHPQHPHHCECHKFATAAIAAMTQPKDRP